MHQPFSINRLLQLQISTAFLIGVRLSLLVFYCQTTNFSDIMCDLVAEGVPARVVMAGTSTMRLHERYELFFSQFRLSFRFSKLPSRKTIKKPAHSVRYSVAPRRVVSYVSFEPLCCCFLHIVYMLADFSLPPDNLN